MEDPAIFVLTVLFILGTPGPTNTLLATSGATVGFRRSLPLIAGESLGYSTTILLVGLLIGPWIAGAPVASTVLRLAVGLFLVWLAVKLWLRGATLRPMEKVVTIPQIVVTTLLNPKAVVFALAVIPFAKPGWPAYFAAFLLLLAGVASGWIALGAGIGRVATARGGAAWVPRVGAVAVMGFALFLIGGPLLR